jgi:hypothetical protein
VTKSANIDEMSILEQMDNYAKSFDFPTLNNWHWRMGKARLTSFLGADEWLVVFEVVGFDVKSYAFENVIYAYGNKIDKPGFQTGIDVLEQPPDKPFEDDEGNTLINLSNFSVIIKGEERHFSPTAEDYVHAGILPHLEMEPAAKVLRWLCFLLPDEFLLTDAEILHLLQRPELDRFLQLNEWAHPDVAAEELPSQNPCMRSLAKAIAQREPALYECPEDKMNTHWSNWPDPPILS